MAARVLNLSVNHVHQDRHIAPTTDGVANRSVLTGPNRVAQQAAVAGFTGPILTIGGDRGVELVPISAARKQWGAGLAGGLVRCPPRPQHFRVLSPDPPCDWVR